MRALAAVAVGLLFVLPVAAEPPEPPWFADVAKEAGLAGAATDVAFIDLDRDGFLDVVLDRRQFLLSEKGARFVPHGKHGLPYPEIERIPLDGSGNPDRAKGAKGPFVPHYLYFADVDNDGDADALLGVHSWWERLDPARGWVTVPECDPGIRSSVWLNDGLGQFARGPESGYTAKGSFAAAMALAVVDHDLDGNLDLYEGAEYRQYGQLYGCGVDRLFRGDGKGGFADVTEKAGLLTIPEPGGPRSSRPSYGVTSCDFDNDGWPDLLQLAYGRQWNYLWRNRGDGTFEEVGIATGFAGDEITHGRYPDWVGRPPEEPYRSNGNTFDCAVGDYDNDGDLDLFLGEICHAWAGESSDPPSILENLGPKEGFRFRRHPVQKILPPREFREPPQNTNYGDLRAAWLDVDLDGRLDLLIASGDYPDGQYLRLYRQRENGTFEEATKAAGFDWEGCGSISVGDFDRDGDPDILAGRSFMRLSKAHRDKYMGGVTVNEPALFRNDIGNRSGNHWLTVRLAGKTANRSGIGARIAVTAGGVTQIRELRCGSGLGNHQDPPEACFGLGKEAKVTKLSVRWPDAKRSEQTFTDLPTDRHVTVEQGKAKPLLEKAR
ncbi:MAG: CRTAC1 family protein [Planctomycetes bacterium]|jgi:hypothetical protein|nr:CRTAC1 family protein [Planctomycetota bacterium]